ncbi:MAG: hypothetical protein EHM67_09435 [Hyphomicrobiaceae bacterium]|nr:MAG: hypothetical protein EHM67_09435 [Hyphomicrobiaceae bacterium]
MKFYRLHLSETGEGSHGYRFFTTKRDALAVARDWKRNESDEAGCYDTEIDVIRIAPTKASILAALNRYAKHNDNG